MLGRHISVQCRVSHPIDRAFSFVFPPVTWWLDHLSLSCPLSNALNTILMDSPFLLSFDFFFFEILGRIRETFAWASSLFL